MTRLFESSVISYGNQTGVLKLFLNSRFESSVISYGNQTLMYSKSDSMCLRVV